MPHTPTRPSKVTLSDLTGDHRPRYSVDPLSDEAFEQEAQSILEPRLTPIVRSQQVELDFRFPLSTYPLGCPERMTWIIQRRKSVARATNEHVTRHRNMMWVAIIGSASTLGALMVASQIEGVIMEPGVSLTPLRWSLIVLVMAAVVCGARFSGMIVHNMLDLSRPKSNAGNPPYHPVPLATDRRWHWQRVEKSIAGRWRISFPWPTRSYEIRRIEPSDLIAVALKRLQAKELAE